VKCRRGSSREGWNAGCSSPNLPKIRLASLESTTFGLVDPKYQLYFASFSFTLTPTSN
jgi:hypothetical protein